jgi:hypothetical protein
VTAALVQGQDPSSIIMVNGDRTREYTYKRGESAPLDTKLGKQEAVVFESTRPGSSRVSKVWHSPSMQYLALRAEQIRKGKVETVMEIVSVEK